MARKIPDLDLEKFDKETEEIYSSNPDGAGQPDPRFLTIVKSGPVKKTRLTTKRDLILGKRRKRRLRDKYAKIGRPQTNHVADALLVALLTSKNLPPFGSPEAAGLYPVVTNALEMMRVAGFNMSECLDVLQQLRKKLQARTGPWRPPSRIRREAMLKQRRPREAA